VDFISRETKNVPPAVAEALEAKDASGKLTHPLRKGPNPILVPGHVEPPPAAAPAKVPSLEGLDPVKALAQVRLCTSLDTLASWHATEKRPDILAAIDTRARELAPPPKG
jgi:hypothetical protein